MILRRLYIKFKIWRIQSQIKNIASETNLFWVSLVSISIKYDTKFDVDKAYKVFLNSQLEKKKKLLQELKILKDILDNI